MNIEREKENPRKDYYKFGGIIDTIDFFYDDLYSDLIVNHHPFNEKFSKDQIIEVLTDLNNNLSLEQDEQSWFAQMKEIALNHKFAPNGKAVKQNPGLYVGTVGDVAELLRISLTSRKNSPNLYYVMKVLGKEKCSSRINNIINSLN